ncbi:MAG: hypothetical protein WA414_11205, partial [Acidobacteriaceae bacterium]
MKKLFVLACLLLVSIAGTAQNTASSWQNLNTLTAGERIQVSSTSAKKITGTFVSVSDAELTLQTGAGQQTLAKPAVRTVKRMKSGHRLRNTAIGAAIGAGAGAGIVAGAWENHGFAGGKGAGAAVGAVIGGLAGAVVGALLPVHATIYS